MFIFFGKGINPSREGNLKFFHSCAKKIIMIVQNKKKIIFGINILILALGIFGISKLTINNDLLENFKKDTIIVKQVYQLQKELDRGRLGFSIILKANGKGAFKRSENLEKLVAIQQYIAKDSEFDVSFSLADVISLIHKRIKNINQDIIPQNNKLIAQYLVLINWEDIKRFINFNYDQTKILVNHQISATNAFQKSKEKLVEKINKILEDSNITFELTGRDLIESDITDNISRGQIESLAFTLVVIFIIIGLLFRSFKIGILSLIPNGFPLFILFGVMGIFGLPLNIGTGLVAVVSIGLAVNDTIHYMVRFNLNVRSGLSHREAMDGAIYEEIRPIVTTSLSLTLGFAIFALSHFVPNIQFGLLAAMTMVTASLYDLFVTPILLSISQKTK